MYDINLKNIKKSIGFYAVFLLVGLLFLGIMGAILVFSITKEKKMDSVVMSSRVEIRESHGDDGIMYSPIYYYEVDGVEYSCGSSSSSSIKPSTENKEVKFYSKNPEECISAYEESTNTILAIFLLLPVIFIAVGVVNIIKVNKRIKLVKELNNTGKLVKNLPYHMEKTNASSNGNVILKPVVEYKLPNGTVLQLQGDPRHDRKQVDADGMVDLIIDENNPDNYFIDFEINRLSGNLPGDYYVDPNAQTTQQPQPMNMMPNQQMMPNNQYGQVQQPMNMMPNQQMMPNNQYGQVQQPMNMIPNQQMMPNNQYGQVQQPMNMMPNQQMMPNDQYGQVQQPMNNGQYPNQNNMQ